MNNGESQASSARENSPAQTAALLGLCLAITTLTTGCGAQIGAAMDGQQPAAMRRKAPQIPGIDPRCPTLTAPACDLAKRGDTALTAAEGILDGKENIDPASCAEVLGSIEASKIQLRNLWDQMFEMLDSYGLPPRDGDALRQRVRSQEDIAQKLRKVEQRVRSQCGNRDE